MVKAVLTTKLISSFDDLPEHRYHFQHTYLRQMEAAVGDLVIYYEPRRRSVDLSSRGGRESYFATAKVRRIVTDTNRPNHYYAMMSHYLEFSTPVRFKNDGVFHETRLQRPDGGTSKGAFGRSVRQLPDAEYDAIVQAGYSSIFRQFERSTEPLSISQKGLAEEQDDFRRPMIERLVYRPFRDAAFAGVIKEAYGDTCAFTGLRIINGGGRSEVQAAHIRPVARGGQDSMRNGLALCGTAHWMFDRGLVSVGDDHSLLLAGSGLPDQVKRMLNSNGRMIAPIRSDAAPHPNLLKWHRENVFKG